MSNLKRLLAAVLLTASGAVAAQQQSPEWQAYSPAAFEQAARQDRLILLDLIAVWCHCCHVMEAAYRCAHGLDYRQFLDPRYRLAAEQVAARLRDFTRAPNGRAIEGLATLHQVTGNKTLLGPAVGALDWVLRNRRAERGGYRHTTIDTVGPCLADNLLAEEAWKQASSEQLLTPFPLPLQGGAA